MQQCPACSTPLDDAARCVTCDAAAEGLALVARADFAPVREMMARLEAAGLGPEMERVPPASAQDVQVPRWNLYVPAGEVPAARDLLREDWAALLEDEAAAVAARRGEEAIDVDAGGRVTCPACGHGFEITGGESLECPECGLGLGSAGPLSADRPKTR